MKSRPKPTINANPPTSGGRGDFTMKEQDEVELTREERIARLEESLRQGIPRAKPKLIAIQASRQMVEAIRTNPKSLKMWAYDPDYGVEVAERPYASAGKVEVCLGPPEGYQVYAAVKRG
jgi:hypothetical protein